VDAVSLSRHRLDIREINRRVCSFNQSINQSSLIKKNLSHDMKGLNKPLIHALKTRKKTLTIEENVTTVAAVKKFIQMKKSTLSSNRLNTVTLGAS